MVQLTELSPELLLCVASFLSQPDLLNVSLTCGHLRTVTEPELFREYDNSHYDPPYESRSFMPFIKRLISKPRLAKYVHIVRLRTWSSVADLNYPNIGIDLVSKRKWQLTYEEYTACSQAAKTAGIISTVSQYETESGMLKRLGLHQFTDGPYEGPTPWYKYMHDTITDIDHVPYDSRFCQLLRIGVEDPLVVLLVALLNNVREVYLHGAPYHQNTLPWPVPQHQFRKLKRFTAMMSDGFFWPLAFFNEHIKSNGLDELEVYGAASEWVPIGLEQEYLPLPLSLPLKSLCISRVVFECCEFSRHDMSMFLNACLGIKSFHYSASERFDPKFVNAAELRELLLPHNETLGYLFLDVRMGRGTRVPLYSLAAFSCLKTIDTPTDTFADLCPTGWDRNAPPSESFRLCNRLPRALQHLTLRFTNTTDIFPLQHIRDLAASHQSKLTCLKSVTIVLHGYQDWHEAVRETVLELNREYEAMTSSETCEIQRVHFHLMLLHDYEKQSYGTAFYNSTTSIRGMRREHETRWVGNKFMHVSKFDLWKPAWLELLRR